MSEKCDVCRRPYCRTLIGDFPRDFEQRAKCWKIGYERLQDELAAAEERGRRRGEAERDELLRAAREGLWKARIRIGILMDRMRGCDDEIKQGRRDKDGHRLSVELEGPSWLDEHAAQIARIDAALAPRDSGKVT